MNIQLANRICFFGLIVIIATIAWGKTLVHPSLLFMPSQIGDYSMNLRLARQTCENGQYPPAFAYPVPAVLMWRFFGSWNFTIGATVWLLILPASMFGNLLLTTSLLSNCKKIGGLIMALAFVATEYFMIWDLRAINTNSCYLLLILLGCCCWHKDQKIWAGIFFGGSVALKIYSVVFFFYLIIQKEWRIGMAMAASILVFFIGIPVFFLGWQEAVLLNDHWIKAISATSDSSFILHYKAYKVSLNWVAMLLLNPEASAGKLNVFNCSVETAASIARYFCAVWATMVAAYFLTTRLVKPHSTFSRLAFLLDISVLLFCPLPASPFLQPHQLVVMIVPAITLVAIAFDISIVTRFRFIAGITVATGACLTEFGPRYPLRGAGIMLTLLVYLVGIWILRRFALSQPCESSKISGGTLS